MRIFKAGSKDSVGKHWILRICTFNLDIGVSALPSKAIQFGLNISSDKSDGTWLSLSLSLPLVTLFLCFDSLRITSDPELDELLLQMSDMRGIAKTDDSVVLLEREEVYGTYIFALDRQILLDHGYIYESDRVNADKWSYIQTHKIRLFRMLDAVEHKRIADTPDLRDSVIPASFRAIVKLDA